MSAAAQGVDARGPVPGTERQARVSCVIRTLNEAAWIERCVETMGSQAGNIEVDFVIVDSGSTDGTVEIVERLGLPLLTVEKQPLAEFDYSRALNLGIDATGGEFVVSIAAHAIPSSDGWLRQMVSHFADPRVVGVDCRQEPWPDATWAELLRIGRQFPTTDIVFEKGGERPMKRFSNASSVFRRATWEEFPFTLPAGEDVEWAQRMVEAGHRIVYESSVAVRHSHNESARDRARRAVNLSRSEDITHGRRTRLPLYARQSLGSAARNMREIRGMDAAPWKKLGYCGSAIAQAFWFFVEQVKLHRAS